jgi:hypothetical protein
MYVFVFVYCTGQLYFTMRITNQTKFNADLIYELQRIHNNRVIPENRSSNKLLGIHLEKSLLFAYHTTCKYLSSKLNKSLYCINRAKNVILNKHLKLFIIPLSTHTYHIVRLTLVVPVIPVFNTFSKSKKGHPYYQYKKILSTSMILKYPLPKTNKLFTT